MPRFPAALAPVTVCLLSVLLVTACGDRTLGERIGMGKNAPDEFAIVKRAPLIMPPDYNLRPPRPGEPRPQESTAPALARADLTGQPAAGAAPAPSAGQRALLAEAGAAEADPQIRQRIAAEAGTPAAADSRSLFGRLFDFGGSQPVPGEEVVDAAAEAERLRAAREEGLPPTAGETPTAVRRSSQPTTFETLGGQTSLGTAGEQVF